MLLLKTDDMEHKSDIAIVGLAVMGENLAMNLERNGYRVSVYNHSPEKTTKFMDRQGSEKNFYAAYTPQQLIDSLARPRKIFLMIKAGEPVDQMIDTLYPLMDFGDLIIDGGNSFYKDTERRCRFLSEKGRLFIGCGVSGGAQGALWGPSMMPGGMEEAWPLVRRIFQSICAKAPDGSPCCEWIGPGGSGHFVKMVHNGIEYADMQLIAETYYMLRMLFAMSNRDMAQIFSEWNKKRLESYLIEITSNILQFKEHTGECLIDMILDTAGQKGTGKWSVESALDENVPLTVIADAVFQRALSFRKDERMEMAETYPREITSVKPSSVHIREIEDALYAAKIISYTQGFGLLKQVSENNNWHLNFAAIASIWRSGCIIRSVFLDKIKDAYTLNPRLENLLGDLFFISAIKEALPGWKHIVSLACDHELSLPAHSSALNYFYSLTTRNLPSNMIQAQRDYFGSHMFERIDAPRGQFYHNNWNVAENNE